MAYSTMIINKARGKRGSRGRVRVRGRRGAKTTTMPATRNTSGDVSALVAKYEKLPYKYKQLLGRAGGVGTGKTGEAPALKRLEKMGLIETVIDESPNIGWGPKHLTRFGLTKDGALLLHVARFRSMPTKTIRHVKWDGSNWQIEDSPVGGQERNAIRNAGRCGPGRYRPKKGPSKGQCVPGIPTPRKGSLGGPGYTSKSSAARHQILKKHIEEHGYRSTLSALQSRINLGHRTMGKKALAAFRTDVKWVQSNSKARNPSTKATYITGDSWMYRGFVIDLEETKPGRWCYFYEAEDKGLRKKIEDAGFYWRGSCSRGLIFGFKTKDYALKDATRRVDQVFENAFPADKARLDAKRNAELAIYDAIAMISREGKPVTRSSVARYIEGQRDHRFFAKRTADFMSLPLNERLQMIDEKIEEGEHVRNPRRRNAGHWDHVQVKRGTSFAISRNAGRPKYVLVVDAEDGDSWSSPFGAFLRDNKDSPDIADMKALRVGQTIGVGGGAAPMFEITGLAQKPKKTRNPKRKKAVKKNAPKKRTKKKVVKRKPAKKKVVRKAKKKVKKVVRRAKKVVRKVDHKAALRNFYNLREDLD